MENIRIERKEYLEKLMAWKGRQVIKVITGVRRCGKSTLMEMFQDHLREGGVLEEQLIAVNLEDYDFRELRKPDRLYAYVKERIVKGKRMYLFLDEIQHCEGFQEVVDSLYIKKDMDVYLTGSNAHMLSGELATLLSGRYVEIKMLPLSFQEYVSSTGSTDDLSRKYAEYLETGAFPYVLELKGHSREIRDYLEGLYHTIVIKDIASRKKITDIMMLQSVTEFVFDSIGSQLSTKKIADTMTSNGRKIDVKTVERYLDGLMESFIIYQARRYNIRGKQYLKTLEKYYVVDIGMRYMLLGTRGTDVGHILENVIYLELKRRGYEVYVGKMDELEVDFVVKEPKKTTYIQVAASVRNSDTLERELTPLQRIPDHYPKLILTLDEDPEADYEGIRRINALDWLMGTAK